jgi:hypothetical protein
MLIYTWLHPMSTPTVYPAQSTLFYFMRQHYLTYVTLHLATPSTVYVLLLHVTLLNGLEISTSPSSTSCDSLWHLSHRFYSLTLPIDHAYVQFRPYSLRLQPLYVYSFPTQALMAEMCAWQPFPHQTGTTILLRRLHEHSHLHLHFSYMQWTSCTFKWLFREHSSYSDLPFHSKHLACAVNIVNIQMPFYFAAYKLPPHAVYIYNFREHFRKYFIWTFFRSLSYETVYSTSLQLYSSELANQWTCIPSFV